MWNHRFGCYPGFQLSFPVTHQFHHQVCFYLKNIVQLRPSLSDCGGDAHFLTWLLQRSPKAWKGSGTHTHLTSSSSTGSWSKFKPLRLWDIPNNKQLNYLFVLCRCYVNSVCPATFWRHALEWDVPWSRPQHFYTEDRFEVIVSMATLEEQIQPLSSVSLQQLQHRPGWKWVKNQCKQRCVCSPSVTLINISCIYLIFLHGNKLKIKWQFMVN